MLSNPKPHVRHTIENQINIALRHLLSQQNRDLHTLTFGCFDRRFWGWKLVDYPEATFQRNVYPLAWWLQRIQNDSANDNPSGLVESLAISVRAGLEFALKIQHTDGSFDQAFPHEHSFGATAFLLHPLIQAYKILQPDASPDFCAGMEAGLIRAADFLYNYDETHGHIANHLAGAALALQVSASLFNQPRYRRRADALLELVLSHQSTEGWFVEYEGADPGYQTLCVHYLAQVYRLQPDSELRDALRRAVDFLAWFVHPDGSFGGEYGSRRTAVYYPGGVACLSSDFKMARKMTQLMVESAVAGQTVTLQDVDIGNLAPLLTSYLLALEHLPSFGTESTDVQIPWQTVSESKEVACQDFPGAGLYIRGTRQFYAIIGAGNGGVFKVFDNKLKKTVWNDGGYVGELANRKRISTQVTDLIRPCQITANQITVDAPFYEMLRTVPSPWQFVALRLLNLTAMRNVRLGNWIKSILVRLLITGKRAVPLKLVRTFIFEPEKIIIHDVLTTSSSLKIRWLSFGQPFVAIHMASARYFQPGDIVSPLEKPVQVDVSTLNETGRSEQRVVL